MKRSKRRFEGALIVVLAALLWHRPAAASPVQNWMLSGHVKPQTLVTNLPADSLLQDFSDDPMRDSAIDLRANLAGGSAGWRWQIDYQMLARQGDQVELARPSSLPGFASAPTSGDEQRVFDLSHVVSEGSDRFIESRIDRLYLVRATASSVIKLGRQAISWGNGLVYNPVDFLNPFDPAALDTEYKTGDDMVYAQYLLDSGDDIQAVWVGRRNDAGEVSRDVSSIALKYHLFSGSRELDLLLAEHYAERIAAVGGSVDIAEAIWRGDLVLTDTDSDGSVGSAVLSWSYSILAWQKNLSTSVEYFYNGFGISDGDYSPRALADEPGLVARVERGELYTLAQNYLAASATVELTPLWLLTTSLFHNMDDGSGLLQLSSRHDLQQDLQLLLALNLPRGDEGSEFGGIDSGIEGRPLSVGASLFAQLAWYF